MIFWQASAVLSGAKTQFRAACERKQVGLRRIHKLKKELRWERQAKGLVEEELNPKWRARKLVKEVFDA